MMKVQIKLLKSPERLTALKSFIVHLTETLLLRKILQLRRQNVTGFSLSMQMNV